MGEGYSVVLANVSCLTNFYSPCIVASKHNTPVFIACITSSMPSLTALAVLINVFGGSLAQRQRFDPFQTVHQSTADELLTLLQRPKRRDRVLSNRRQTQVSPDFGCHDISHQIALPHTRAQPVMVRLHRQSVNTSRLFQHHDSR